MTKFTISIALLFCFGFSFGQAKNLFGIIRPNGDTSFWYKYQNILIKNLSLKRLDSDSLPYYFRVWKANQVLDIWKTSEDSLFGQVTSWAVEYTPNKEKATHRIFIDKRIIRSDTINQIHKLIETSRIIELPTDDSIKGWKQGCDGVTYITEFSSKIKYSFKTYWTPKAQDTTLEEAKHVQHFVDKIFELSNSAAIWKNFAKAIPYECYRLGGAIACKVMTKNGKRKFANERENYRQQINLQKQASTY